jgi:hypothetical protein
MAETQASQVRAGTACRQRTAGGDILAQPARPMAEPEHDMPMMQEVVRTVYLGRRGRGLLRQAA